jgi:hypothetical protein
MYESLSQLLEEIIQTTANNAVSGAMDEAISDADISGMVTQAVSGANIPYMVQHSVDMAITNADIANTIYNTVTGSVPSSGSIENMVYNAVSQIELPKPTGSAVWYGSGVTWY